jgi:hypothetical protein
MRDGTILAIDVYRPEREGSYPLLRGSSQSGKRISGEKPCVWGPFGAKGFSETAMTALGPAIANAIYSATGVRMYCASLTPENLLREIEKKNRID